MRIAAISFSLMGVVVALRGELNAQALQHRRDEILADLPRRAREIEQQLSDPAIDAATKERLEGQLDDCKREVTGIPSYFPFNERVSNYFIGGSLAAIGLWCLFHKPKPIRT